MQENIEFQKGDFGLCGIIKSKWEPSFLQILLDKQVNEIELNDGKGWSAKDIDFVKSFPNLKCLRIYDLGIKSVEPIHYLTNLVKLEIITYCRTPIDFTVFPYLEECAFEWRKNSDSLFEKRNLKFLFINRCDKPRSEVFSNFINLEKLTILNSEITDIGGFRSLKQLNHLRLGNLKKIRSLQYLEELINLSYLEIQRCKNITSLSPVFKLRNLKTLFVIDSGEIQTLSGIENLENLKEFLFYDSTNILDGDLSPLFKLKTLSKISFQNRKHSPTKERISEAYSISG